MNLVSKKQEKELLLKLIEGDENAFERIYYAYSERVYYFAFGYLKNARDCEELVQEVFTKIWENRGKINVDLSFSGYILTTCKNTIFNDYRKKINHESYCSYILNYLQRNSTSVDDEVVYNDLMDLLHKTIDSLPPKRKEIFRLSRFQGLAYKEISEQLSISEKTIETHMRLALRDIKIVFEPILEKLIP